MECDTVLHAGNIYSRLVSTDRNLIEKLHEKMRFRPPNFWHNAAFKKKKWDGWKEFFDLKTGRFLSGLIPEVMAALRYLKKPYKFIDERTKIDWAETNIDDQFLNRWLPPDTDPVTLHDFQSDLANQCFKYNRGIVRAPTGCHRKGQKVILHSGRLKSVEDVVVGDRLMGPDGAARTVLGLCRGHDEMYRIQPKKGDPFFVNGDHVLTLIKTKSGNRWLSERKSGCLVDVSVRNWLAWSKWQKHIHKLVRTGVEFQNPFKGSIEPYFVGLMLGDGSLRHVPALHNVHPTLIDMASSKANQEGLKLVTRQRRAGSLSHFFVGTKGKQNPLAKKLSDLGLWNIGCADKYIPDVFKCADRQTRLSLLAGLIDTDGSLEKQCYYIVSKSQKLIADVVWVARSLGFYSRATKTRKKSQTGKCGIYYLASICGHIDEIPSLIKAAKPRRQKKDVLRSGFSVEKVADSEEYFGFTLDGDQRYLLDDFTITHNSGKTFILVSILKSLPPKTPTLFLTKNAGLVHQSWKDMKKWGVPNLGRWYDKYKEPNFVMCATVHKATFESLAKLLPKFKVLLVDEVHDCVSDVPLRAYKKMTSAGIRIGFSATPFKWHKKKINNVHKYNIKGYFGPILKTRTTASGELTTKELQARGILSPSDCHVYPIEHPDLSFEPYQDAVKLGIEQNIDYHQIVARLVKKCTGRTLVVVERIEQGRYLNQLIPDSVFMQGKDSLKDREPTLNSLYSGDRFVGIVMRHIITAGINIKIHDLINAAGGEGAHNVVQLMGRGLRTANDKDMLRYHDFVFYNNDYLRNHSEWRIEVLQDEGHKVTLYDKLPF